MRLSQLDHAAVLHVVARAHDLEEVYTLNGHRNPFIVMNGIMAHASFAWLVWDGDEPCTVFGAAPGNAGVYKAFLLTTDRFPKIALPLTRFVKRTVIPTLFGDLNAHRLEADLHEKHTHIHRWVEALGAERESVRKQLAPDGSDYFHYALLRQPAKLDKSDKP